MGGRWVSQELNPSYKFGADLQKLEMGEPQSLPVEGKRAGAARFGAERPDEGIGERAAPLLERDHGGKDFLLALDRDDVGLQHALDGGRDLGACKPVGAIEDPGGFGHGDDADETAIVLGQLPLDEPRRLRGLNGIVLRQVADQDVGIEPDHRRLRRRATSAAAPAIAASRISSIVTLRRPRGLMMPRRADAGSFGNRTTLPSGCTKNLTRSPGFNRRCSRMAFGIVAWPLLVSVLVSADSMPPPLHIT